MTDETPDDDAVTPEFGDAEVTIDVTPEVAREAYASYQAAVAEGYSSSFDTYLFNHTAATWTVTVDGEPFEELADQEDETDA